MNISVVIPAHGKRDLLVSCLKSLSAQVDFEFEVCVIDDGSGLHKNEIISKSDVNYPLIWRSFDSPKGRSAARNEGIRSTSGKFIVFLDSDMDVKSGFLEAHLNYHQGHPHTAVVGKIIWPSEGSFQKYVGNRGIAKLATGAPIPPWYFPTGNSSVERGDLTSESPFDETLLGWGGEDLDLGMQLHANGVTFACEYKAVSFHNFDGDLATHMERTYSYGRYSLPVLADRYPEIITISKLHLLDSILWRVLISKIFFAPVLIFARLFDRFPLPAFLFDYLTFASYSHGWLERDAR